MNPHIATLLQSIKPADTSGLRLVAEFMERAPDPGEYIRRAEEVTEAVDYLEGLAKRSKEVAKRCQRLRPTSSPQVPAGF